MGEIKSNSRTNNGQFFSMYMIEPHAVYRKYQVSSTYFSGIFLLYLLTLMATKTLMHFNKFGSLASNSALQLENNQNQDTHNELQ